MRLSAFVSFLHSVGPVVIGISLGFSLSLLCVSWTDESCYPNGEDGEGVSLGQDGPLRGARKPSSLSNSHDMESDEDFEPRIVPYKQVRPSSPKKVFRQVLSLKSTGEHQLMCRTCICSKSQYSRAACLTFPMIFRFITVSDSRLVFVICSHVRLRISAEF